jgi:hypothetical protein
MPRTTDRPRRLYLRYGLTRISTSSFAAATISVWFSGILVFSITHNAQFGLITKAQHPGPVPRRAGFTNRAGMTWVARSAPVASSFD